MAILTLTNAAYAFSKNTCAHAKQKVHGTKAKKPAILSCWLFS